MKNYEIGDRVEVKNHGCGTVKGFDLPRSKNKRIIVDLDEPIINNDSPCFFPEELELIPEIDDDAWLPELTLH